MTDKKKKYLVPEMKVVLLDQADIIATSNEGLTEDDFDWGSGPSGSSTESLTEDNFGW